MKYMGSKRAMLLNGLGDILDREIYEAERFIDLFSGSGVVSVHVAEKYNTPVLAVDLQYYSSILINAVISRNRPLNIHRTSDNWISRAEKVYSRQSVPIIDDYNAATILFLREWSNRQMNLPITQAYGGHYFSPEQAVWLDALRQTLPTHKSSKLVALAALIKVASQCAASPGHTAQPLQPTPTALPFVKDAWTKNIIYRVKQEFACLSQRYSKQIGNAVVGDANVFIKHIKHGDLVFLDPPYSAVQYSRFYHVLETIAWGSCGDVFGVGRYPDRCKRPISKYSLISEAYKAVEDLIVRLAHKKVRAIITFPDHQCSNGLSGNTIREISNRYFNIIENSVESKFSTLGGTGDKMEKITRSARLKAKELMLVLEPRV